MVGEGMGMRAGTRMVPVLLVPVRLFVAGGDSKYCYSDLPVTFLAV